MKNDIIQGFKAAVTTMFVCCVLYTGAVYAVGFLAKDKAEGSLIYKDGKVIGSRLIAQNFTSGKYFHPRPSAVDYNGAGAGGSNLSPYSKEIRERAEKIIAGNGGGLPADMVTASGSGLDPHISFDAALFQAKRVANARNMDINTVVAVINRHSENDLKIVNVLELNMALDNAE
ncbi:potassium-transporting ATPase subunit C [Sphaerochaeta sp.]|uniref:potassium-transporting ATPase subunit C n=1 Tax=Sphaerochaeta sp. TaxID=1972642 RepID=UPI003D109743